MSEQKESLLKFLRLEKEAADNWVVKNTNDGFPDGVPGWQERSDRISGWIDLVEGCES